MGTRLELHELLTNVLGSNNVYFQPPPTVKMAYPCIVYKRENIKTEFSDNSPYKIEKQYLITLIDKNPDSEFVDLIVKLPKCSFERNYVADGLNHDIFRLFF